MVIAISIFELHLPQAHSLKQKRKVVKGLVERLHQRFRVSVAETGFHDLHQRSEITIAAVALDDAAGQRLMSSIRELIDGEGEATLLFWEPQYLEGQA